MEQEEEGDADKVVQAINQLGEQVQHLAQGQEELWAELDRRTSIDPGSLVLSQKLEMVHGDLRRLLGIVEVITYPDSEPKQEE